MGKVKVAEEFSRAVLNKAGENIHKIIVFGSVAKGLANENSDIDVLVVVSDLNEDVRKVLSEAAFEIGLRTGESIEYITMDVEEYVRRGLGDPLMHEVETHGKIIHFNPSLEAERAKNRLKLPPMEKSTQISRLSTQELSAR